MLGDGDEVPLVELKHGGEHLCELPDAVKKLDKSWGDFLWVPLNVPAPVVEFVPETQPVLFNEGLESVNGAVVAVQDQGGQRAGL